jgi:hypothetical protein
MEDGLRMWDLTKLLDLMQHFMDTCCIHRFWESWQDFLALGSKIRWVANMHESSFDDRMLLMSL